MRLGAGSANPKRDNVQEHRVRYVRAAADLVYQGRGDAVNAYVGAGLGVYHMRGASNGGNDRSETATRPGASVFAGGEFVIGDAMSLSVEARGHAIADPGVFVPDGLGLTIGLKKHF